MGFFQAKVKLEKNISTVHVTCLGNGKENKEEKEDKIEKTHLISCRFENFA